MELLDCFDNLADRETVAKGSQQRKVNKLKFLSAGNLATSRLLKPRGASLIVWKNT
jgi:hypothetical protein